MSTVGILCNAGNIGNAALPVQRYALQLRVLAWAWRCRSKVLTSANCYLYGHRREHCRRNKRFHSAISERDWRGVVPDYQLCFWLIIIKPSDDTVTCCWKKLSEWNTAIEPLFLPSLAATRLIMHFLIREQLGHYFSNMVVIGGMAFKWYEWLLNIILIKLPGETSFQRWNIWMWVNSAIWTRIHLCPMAYRIDQ